MAKDIKVHGMKIEGGEVDKAFLASFDSEAAFIEAMGDKTYKHLFEGDNREAKLSEVYNSYKPKAEAPSDDVVSNNESIKAPLKKGK